MIICWVSWSLSVRKISSILFFLLAPLLVKALFLCKLHKGICLNLISCVSPSAQTFSFIICSLLGFLIFLFCYRPSSIILTTIRVPQNPVWSAGVAHLHFIWEPSVAERGRPPATFTAAAASGAAEAPAGHGIQAPLLREGGCQDQRWPTWSTLPAGERQLDPWRSASLAQRLSLLFPVLQLRALVSWESPGRYFMIGRFFWDLFGAFSCRFLSIDQPGGAQLPTHTLNYCKELSRVLVF